MMRGYQELPNGDVQITMSREDWNGVLLSLGYARGSATDSKMAHSILSLINRINAGNPNFVPYEITPKKGAA